MVSPDPLRHPPDFRERRNPVGGKGIEPSTSQL
jgi:hypothetical protein